MPRRIPPRKNPAGGKPRRRSAVRHPSPKEIAEFRRLFASTGNRARPPRPAGVSQEMADFIHRAINENIAGTRLNAERAAIQIAERYGDHPHVSFVLQALPESVYGRVMFHIEQITKGKKGN